MFVYQLPPQFGKRTARDCKWKSSIAAIGIIFCDDRDGLAGWCVLQVGI
jgi:hypothetical protein